MPAGPTCEKGGCTEDAGGNRFCRTHECKMGGCSNPSSTGDGDTYCSTHECVTSGCREQAYGNELFCTDHLKEE